MANISAKRHATIELSEEDWKKINAVYNILSDIDAELEDVGLEFDSPEVKYEGFNDYPIGEQLESLYNAIDELQCERTGSWG